MKNKRILKEKGITLIALVVTIVVLLILAGVTINAVFSDSGIIKKAQDAQNKANESVQKDMEQINALENWLNENTGESNNDKEVNISTLVGKEAVTKNTKAIDAYENKITIPKGFKVLEHNPTSSTGVVTYTYSGDNIPAVQDGIVIEDKDGNQFVWVPVGTIKNKDNTTSTITLGRYKFDYSTGKETLMQNANEYQQETIITAETQKKDYTLAKLNLQDNKAKINKAIQLEGILNNAEIITTAPEIQSVTDYKELATFRVGNTATDATAENATARDLKTFLETSLANGGYYVARFEAGGTIAKITSKYNQTVLTNITQPNAAKYAREMYGEVKENNELIYASDLVNSYAWDTTIIFIQTYSGESNYGKKNKSTSFANTGINNDKYCNIWDMSGNALEWSTEYTAYNYKNEFYPCGFRGGYYDSSIQGETLGRRIGYAYGHTTISSAKNIGLRPILYVK